MQLSLSETYRGQWLDILGAFGIERFTNKVCPICGGEDRATLQQSGVLFCRHCGSHDPVAVLEKIKGWDFKTVAKNVRDLKGDFHDVVKAEVKPDASAVNSLLRNAKPLKGSLAEKYLLNRGCVLPEKDVLFSPSAWFTVEGNLPKTSAMLALAKDSEGKLKGVHKTALNKAASKHEIGKQITAIKHVTFNQCAVQLFNVKQTMGIAEGIETALSATKLFQIPTWAAINNILLENFVVPAGVKCVTIFADNDANFVGQCSAFVLAKRLASEGLSVNVLVSTLNDFNDDLRAA